MTDVDWGPFPELADALRLHPREPQLDWLGRFARTGLPWQHLVRTPKVGFWPPNLPEQIPNARPRLPGPWGWRLGPPVVLDTAPLETLLPACHAWMAVENARYLLPWLMPDPRMTPDRSFFATSDTALVWSLAAWAACAHGPAALLKEKAALQKAGPGAVGPGDLLALHRNVEALAVFWAGQYGQPADPPIAFDGGGLRREAVLRAFTTLPAPHLNALVFLASHSPLTWLAYLDVLPLAPPAGIFSSLPLAAPAYSRKSAPWLALLANTLFGALLSANPAWDDWQRAESELHRMEAEAARWGLWQKIFQGYRIDRLRTKRLRLRRLALGHLVFRLESWHALAVHEPRSALLDIHIMALDRMARTAVVRAHAPMRRDWQLISQARAGRSASEYLFQQRSAYYEELSRLFLGSPFEEILKGLKDSELSRLAVVFEGLLSINIPPVCSVPVERFFNQLNHGVRLPFRAPDHRGPSINEIFEGLLQELLRQLPDVPDEQEAAEPGTAVSSEEETDDAYAYQ